MHSEKMDQVLDVIRFAGEPITPAEVCASLPDISNGTIHTYLRRLERRGFLRRVHRGQYVYINKL